MANASAIEVKGKIGDFFALTFDEEKTKTGGRMKPGCDPDEYTYGVFFGQLKKLVNTKSGRVARFTLAAPPSDDTDVSTWDVEYLIDEGFTSGGLGVLSVNRIDLVGHFDRTQISQWVDAAVKTHMKLIGEEIKQRAPVVRVFEVKKGGKTKTTGGGKVILHRNFGRLLEKLAAGKHCYLFGPPGSFKSFSAAQAFEAMGLEYGYMSISPDTSEAKIFGYNDAQGRHVETEYFRRYAKGGGMTFDEFDAGRPGVLTSVNGSISSMIGSFPHGNIKRHDDFRLVATGNTSGRGPDPLFPDRQQFDAALADRFCFIHWPYDIDAEAALFRSKTNKDVWLEYLIKLRALCQQSYPNVLVTPRATLAIADDLAGDTSDTPIQLLDAYVFKGVQNSMRQSILNACPINHL